jgi:predicted dehydrogenase
VTGILDFANGAIGTIVTSFDSWTRENRLEIYGTEGTLGVPDPNTFGGPVRLRRPRSEEWEELPLTHDHAENSRGIGPADLAAAIREQRQPRASGQMAFHVLEIMHAIHDASAAGRHVQLASTVERPAPRPALEQAVL